MSPRPDAIGLLATDLPTTLAFYRRLGLEFPDGADTEPHVEYVLPGGVRLMWDPVTTIRSFHPEWKPPSGSPRIALAFACDDAADVDKVYADVVGAGATSVLEPFDAPWGQRYASVLDPDGNGVDLFAAIG